MKKMIRIAFWFVLVFIIWNVAELILEQNPGDIQTANTGSPETGTEEKNIILDISSNFEFAYTCGTVEELESHSDIIIKGTVTACEPWINDDATIGTDYTVQVEKCYRGELEKGDTVTVSNLGGDISARKYFEKQKDPKAGEFRTEMEKDPEHAYVRFRCDGAWLPEEKKTYVWFLEADAEQGSDVCNPVNVYEGIYEIEGENVNRYQPDTMETAGGVSASGNQMSLSELERQITDGAK